MLSDAMKCKLSGVFFFFFFFQLWFCSAKSDLTVAPMNFTDTHGHKKPASKPGRRMKTTPEQAASQFGEPLSHTASAADASQKCFNGSPAVASAAACQVFMFQ